MCCPRRGGPWSPAPQRPDDGASIRMGGQRRVMDVEFLRVATLADLPEGEPRTVEVLGVPVALYNIKGEIFATQDACPHQGVSLGCGGYLQGENIVCGYHHWEFSVRSGASVDGLGDPLYTFPVEIRGRDVYIGIPVVEEGT